MRNLGIAEIEEKERLYEEEAKRLEKYYFEMTHHEDHLINQ